MFYSSSTDRVERVQKLGISALGETETTFQIVFVKCFFHANSGSSYLGLHKMLLPELY